MAEPLYVWIVKGDVGLNVDDNDRWELGKILSITVSYKVNFDVSFNFPGQWAENRILAVMFGQQANIRFTTVKEYTTGEFSDMLSKIKEYTSPNIFDKFTLLICDGECNVDTETGSVTNCLAYFRGRLGAASVSMQKMSTREIVVDGTFEVGQ